MKTEMINPKLEDMTGFKPHNHVPELETSPQEFVITRPADMTVVIESMISNVLKSSGYYSRSALAWNSTWSFMKLEMK